MANPNDLKIKNQGTTIAGNPHEIDFEGNVSASLSADGSKVTVTEKANPTATATALAATGTVSLDPTVSRLFTITPTGAVTLNAASAPAGAIVTVVVTTSGTSSFNVTPTTNFKTTGALATGTTSGKVFTLTFIGDGTNMNEVARTTAM